MSLAKTGKSSPNYLLQYAEEGGERPGVWIGRGAAALGLSGTVQPDVFRNLFAGLTPDGSKPIVGLSSIRHDYQRAGGWDLTQSIPKDASILAAYFVGARPVIERAVMEAAEATVDAIEQNYAFVRRGSGGKTLEPCQLIVAAFLHNTSRNNDPQWHVHLLLLNVGKHSNGFGTIVSKVLYDNQTTIDRIFKAAFAIALQRDLGVELQSTVQKPFEPGEAFNIRGVPDELRKGLSSRRAEIMTAMAERGSTSGRGSEIANLATRKEKNHQPIAVLQEQWHKVARSFGIDVKEMERAIFESRLSTKQTLPNASLESAPTQKAAAPSKAESIIDIESDGSKTRTFAVQTPQTFSTRLQTSQMAGVANEISTSVIASIFHSAAANKEFTPVIDHLIDATLEAADREQSNRLRASVGSRPEEAEAVLPDVLHIAEQLQVRKRHIIAAEDIKVGLFGRLTSRHADAAFVETLSRTGSIACVDAQHGVDANLFVGALANQYEKSGFKVRAFTSTTTAASELEAIVGSAVHTTGRLLARLKSTPAEILKHHAIQLIRTAVDAPTRERWQFDPRTVVIITQAQILKTVQLNRIMSEAKAADSKVVLVGSTDQLVRREPHNAFTEIATRVGKVSLPNCVTPVNGWMADATRQVSRGDIRGALSEYALTDRLHLAKDQRSAAVELASYWRTLPKHEQNGKVLMIAASKREARVLNALAHEHRRADGGLGMFMRQKVDGTWARRGDRILFHGGSKHLGFRAGDLGTIQKIGVDGMQIRLDRTKRALLANRTISVHVPKNLYKLLALGYAVTANEAQGMSCEKALVLPKAGGSDVRSLLVQLSRARADTRVFTTARSIGEDVEALARGDEAVRHKIVETLRRAIADAQRGQPDHIVEQKNEARHRQRISP